MASPKLPTTTAEDLTTDLKIPEQGHQRLQKAQVLNSPWPKIPSFRPCLEDGKWRATGSGPDGFRLSPKKWIRYKLDTSYTEKVSSGLFCILMVF